MKVEIVGKRFNRLVVLSEYGKTPLRSLTYLCKCDCGVEKVIDGHTLRSGKTQSCGCLNKEILSKNNSLDILGQKFNRLTAIEKTDYKRGNSHVWKFQCDCGKYTYAEASRVVKGRNKSCGCLHADVLSEISGVKHYAWKGDKVAYGALHSWVKRKLGKSIKCEKCGDTERNLQWSNKDHLYKRNLTDWQQLCSKCHGIYDKQLRIIIKQGEKLCQPI
jgi:hypothetical protein